MKEKEFVAILTPGLAQPPSSVKTVRHLIASTIILDKKIYINRL